MSPYHQAGPAQMAQQVPGVHNAFNPGGGLACHPYPTLPYQGLL